MFTEFRTKRSSEEFDRAADEAKRELYPELYWGTVPPDVITICRICKGNGYHKEECDILHPDKKEKASVEDLLKVTDKDVQRLTWEELQALKEAKEEPPEAENSGNTEVPRQPNTNS